MASPYKLHIHRWAKPKQINVLTAALVQQVAVEADMAHDLVLWLRKGVVDEILPARPPAAEWLGLYHGHQRVFLSAVDQLPEFGATGKEVGVMLNESRALEVWARSDPDELKQWLKRMGQQRLNNWAITGIRLAHRRYKRHLRELRRMLRNQDNRTADAFGERLARSPELYFFFRVTIPCLAVYRRHPRSMLHRAQRGDMQAIEALVRVDDLVIHDPIITQWASQQHGQVRKERQRLLRQWADQGLDHGQFSARQVKLSMAGLISAMVEVARPGHGLAGQRFASGQTDRRRNPPAFRCCGPRSRWP